MDIEAEVHALRAEVRNMAVMIDALGTTVAWLIEAVKDYTSDVTDLVKAVGADGPVRGSDD